MPDVSLLWGRVDYRTSSGVSGLFSLDASNFPPCSKTVTTKTVSWHFQVYPWGQIVPSLESLAQKEKVCAVTSSRAGTGTKWDGGSAEHGDPNRGCHGPGFTLFSQNSFLWSFWQLSKKVQFTHFTDKKTEAHGMKKHLGEFCTSSNWQDQSFRLGLSGTSQAGTNFIWS